MGEREVKERGKVGIQSQRLHTFSCSQEPQKPPKTLALPYKILNLPFQKVSLQPSPLPISPETRVHTGSSQSALQDCLFGAFPPLFSTDTPSTLLFLGSPCFLDPLGWATMDADVVFSPREANPCECDCECEGWWQPGHWALVPLSWGCRRD